MPDGEVVRRDRRPAIRRCLHQHAALDSLWEQRKGSFASWLLLWPSLLLTRLHAAGYPRPCARGRVLGHPRAFALRDDAHAHLARSC